MVIFDFFRFGVLVINLLLYIFLKNDFRKVFVFFLKCRRINF